MFVKYVCFAHGNLICKLFSLNSKRKSGLEKMETILISHYHFERNGSTNSRTKSFHCVKLYENTQYN